MKRIAVLVFLMMLVVVTPLFAQGEMFLVDETQSLDREAVIAAGESLIARDAWIGVYLITGGGEGDLIDNLRTDGLIDDAGNLRRDAIVVYISIDPDRHEIRYGDKWREALDEHLPIQVDELLPYYLDQRDYQLAIESTLQSIDTALILHDNENQEWQFLLLGAVIMLGLVLGLVRLIYLFVRGIFKLGRQLSN